ncbi:hemagglutinin repeat-containing protein [Limnobaculum parvum]|nr:hemagglutinin repeat-containing protein [Limnobaculum parvum]
MKDVSVVTRPPSLNLILPNASLYKINPAVGSRYLIETDPQYTQLKRWLGSDYMTSRLQADPNNMHKRLGDGYYEQRLISDQIINLTGQRFLNGYANDEEQYMALMNSGVEFAQKYPLSLGIALTPEQMANLTSDIVWLVSRDVTLPDGSIQTVLVPQVYAMIRPQDIDGSGALLAGKQVNLQLTGDLVNQGRILAGDKLNVLAQNIQNMGGSISGNNVMLLANNDINNIGGLMQGFDSLRLQAGHDINLITTTTQGEKAGRNGSSHTAINQVAALAVNHDNGTLQLSAGHDINLTAALLSNAGQNSDTSIAAGHDLNLNTVTVAKQAEFYKDKNNYRRESTSSEVGSQMTGSGDITLSAKNDINARAAQVEAGGQLGVIAGNNLSMTTGESTEDLSEHSKYSSRGSFGKKLTSESHDELHAVSGVSSNFSGDSVVMKAGNDLLVHGSQVTGIHDVSLSAGNDLTIDTAAEKRDEMHLSRTTKSGLMGTGGIGFTVGKIDEKFTNTTHGIGNLGSIVGSTEGNVTLSAGNHLAIKGSDVVAQQDISLTGKNVTVESVENQTHIQDKYERTQSGVTVALSGAVGGALNAAVTEAKQAQETHDSKIKALQEIKAALSAAQAVQAGMMDLPKDSEGFVGISISGGAQRTESTTDTNIRAAQGSTIAAGNNLSITATGNGEKGVDGDITLKGSAINAGNNMLLDANRDVNLLAAANTQKTDSENKSYGGNAGVSFGIGGGKNGLRFFADANFSQGNMHADGLYWTESQLEAGNNLTIISGRDTNLIGALAKGDSVTMDVGRDLTVRSLQDTDDYSYEQYSLNIAGSYGTGFDGSLGFTMDKMDSTWASVNEQSGIYAGKGGYDITVGKHTQLDGAVIASEATADKNNLDTGTLGWSDIKNKADYDVSHVSMSIGSGGGAPFGFPGVPGTPIVVAYGDSASSTTHAAIADGTLTIRDQSNQQQDIAKLSNDTANAANPLDKIFDADEQMRNLEAIGLAGQIVSQVTTIATNIGVKAAQDEAHAKADAQKDSAANDPAIIAQARADLSKAGNDNPTQEELNKATYDVVYQAEFKIANEKQMKEYGTGSDVQRAIQAAGAALTVAMGGGSVGNAAAAASAPYLAQGVKVLTEGPEMKDKAINAIAHAIIGAAVAQGSGNSAASGAIGAASGEIIAQTITQYLYEGRKPEELTEEQRQAVAALSMIASGAIGGVVGDSTESAATSANAGYNAAVNNFLSPEKAETLIKSIEDQKAGKNLVEASLNIVKLTNEDRASNVLLELYQSGQPMTESQKQELAGLLDQYGYELQVMYGFTPQKANEAIQGVLAGKAFVASTGDISAYNEALSYLKTASVHTSQAIMGTDALMALPGAPGIVARSALAAGGAYQAGYGLGQLSDGNYGEGAWNVGLGTAAIFGGVAGNSVISRTDRAIASPGKAVSWQESSLFPNSKADTSPLSIQAQKDLLDEINKFRSRTQATNTSTMIGAYDSATGKTAIGFSNNNITAELLDSKTVTYIESQLGAKIGEFTSFCKNTVGACAEVSAADQLIRQGADPASIKFTRAVRPRDAYGKKEVPAKAIVDTCENCAATWPNGNKK